MATTTNFGWTTPNDTDLVKDGAAAIRTLGQAIDTSLMDLEGGTTGQVLKKNSNTDMDFIWAADSAGMTNPLTTTGDTIYSSSGTTPARLGIGSTGQVLTVASGIPSWATPAGAAFVGCLAQISGSQTISNNTQTKKTFTGADVYDTDAFHDPSSNDTRITIPAGLGGYYLIYGAVTWDNNTSGRRYITFTKNNADLNFTANAFSTATNTIYPTSMVSVVVNLSAGDYIELEIWQSTGGNLNTDNGAPGSWFGVAKL
jgi:hypothetical protein